MIHTSARGVSRMAVVLAAGLVLAAPAAASEGPLGPPAGPPPGPPLANPLAPPTFTPPSVAPGTPPKGTKRAARPRVVKARKALLPAATAYDGLHADLRARAATLL